MQMMGPTRCPEIIVVVVIVVVAIIVPIVEMVGKLSYHHSDISEEFHSGDTSTT
jgi:hypothetical protein